MRTLFFLTLLLISKLALSTEIYSKAFGNPDDPAIVFLHGGPGYNCASFEGTTARKLSQSGFYVVVYDRRGEGRSFDPKAKFDFKQSFKDLKGLYKKYDIQKATLIGHSFGGILGTKFSQKNPEMVQALVLVGAPISLQESFLTIIESSRKMYSEKGDYNNLSYIDMLKEMNPESLEYAIYCFAHAMQNGFYSPDSLSNEAKEIYADFQSDSVVFSYASEMTQDGPLGFWENEAYTTLDLTADLKALISDGFQVYGMYGQEDGLYSKKQIETLTEIVGDRNISYLENCSHSVFIDQQTQFINNLKAWLLQR